jgi:hypothetical protein
MVLERMGQQALLPMPIVFLHEKNTNESIHTTIKLLASHKEDFKVQRDNQIGCSKNRAQHEMLITFWNVKQ